METRTLGDSDLVLSRLGCGAWAIDESGRELAWGEQDDRDSIAGILKALELGVNWIDTAAAFRMGHSEEVVARALVAQWRGERPYLFTKCGLRWDDAGRRPRVLSAASIREECEHSLRRLQTDVIDLYQMHWPLEDNGSSLEEAWSTMASLQKEGKVRYIGMSNVDLAQIERAHAIAAVTSLQSYYSLIHREVEASILPHCQSNLIGAIACSPMASGLLTGDLVERLRTVGWRHDRRPGDVAVAWVLRKFSITAAIVGVRNAHQAEQTVRAAELRLTAEEIAEVEGAMSLAVR
jgi:aryl-alcohol dehydrogenase-like predicted oxidoreductase